MGAKAIHFGFGSIFGVGSKGYKLWFREHFWFGSKGFSFRSILEPEAKALLSGAFLGWEQRLYTLILEALLVRSKGYIDFGFRSILELGAKALVSGANLGWDKMEM